MPDVHVHAWCPFLCLFHSHVLVKVNARYSYPARPPCTCTCTCQCLCSFLPSYQFYNSLVKRNRKIYFKIESRAKQCLGAQKSPHLMFFHGRFRYFPVYFSQLWKGMKNKQKHVPSRPAQGNPTIHVF
jgi:hypothetical protein